MSADTVNPDTTGTETSEDVTEKSEGISVDNESKAEIAPSASQITAEMMQNPHVLAALQNRIEEMVGQSSGYIQSLPPAVKRRVNALKNLQVKSLKMESKFFEEVHLLEKKYMDLYGPMYDQRRNIIDGVVEPTDSECDWDSDEDDEEIQNKEEQKKEKDLSNTATEESKVDTDVKGIPEFWLTIFKSTDVLQDMIQDHDEPILKSLQDIRVAFSESTNPMTFTLEFIFEPNEYFTNTVLKKCYKMRHMPDEKDPFSFDAPEIVECKGCEIDWKKGKNVTVKTIKKKQKHKGRGTVRTVSKQVANDSFFNFFSPPEVQGDTEGDMDSDTEQLLTSDFEIGHMIRERIVPRAVLYFTGEAQMQYDYDEEEEEQDDGDSEQGIRESADSENDSDYDPSKDPAASKGGAQECKQQ